MTLNSLFRTFGALALVAFIGACGDSKEEAPCITTSDCPEGLQCIEGECASASSSCETTTDCNFGNYCADGECVDATCSEDTDCTDAVCVNSRCRSGCSTADQCDTGQVCNQVTRLCETAGCTTASCPQFQTCDTDSTPSACRYTGDCNNDAVCTAYAQQLGDGDEYICSTAQERCVIKPECGDDSDCVIGDICEPRSTDGRRVCRRGCRVNDECGLSQICSAEQGFRCVEGCETTADCTTEGQACFNRECVDTCATRSECTAINPGYICTGSPRVCQSCTDSSQCPASQFCDFTQGNSEEEANNPSRGLCVNLPPTCPPDPYGDNDSIDDAFVITGLPFAPVEADQPSFCREKANGDWFRFEAALGDVIEIQLDYASAGNLDIALRTVDGVELAVSDRPPSEDEGQELIRYGTQVGGTFLLQVRGAILTDSVPYSLTIDASTPPACVDDAYEPNNTIAEAMSLAPDTDVSLQVCGNDSDFFLLEALDNQIVTIRAAAPARLGNVDLILRNEAGDIIAQAVSDSDVEQIQVVNENAQTLNLEVRVATNAGNVDYALEWTQRDNQCSDEFEPNDTCPTATLMTNGVYTDLAVCSDADYYAVDLFPLQTVTFRAIYDPSVAAGDLDITLFGPNDCSTFVATETRVPIPNSTLVAEEIQYTAPSGGRFNLLVNLFAGISVPYTLEVDVQDGPPCIDDSLEPNNLADDATTIPVADARLGTDNVVTGLRICDADADWFAIELSDSDIIRWDVVFDHDAGDIDAQIIGPDKTTVLASSIGTTGTESLTYTVGTGEAGTYYLRVQGKDPVRNDYWLLTYVNGVGPADPACPDPYENNDNAGEASPITPGNFGLLICTGDDDWFETTILAGETITIDLLFTHAQGNVDLVLYGDRSATNSIAESRTFSDNESVTFTSARDQTLTWRVYSVGNGIQSPYSMNVALTPAPPCVDDSLAPNGNSSDAPTIAAPGLYSPLIKCEGSEDWFKVVLEPEPFEAYINFSHALADLNLTVYDSTMTIVGEGDSTTDNESVAFTPSVAGTYFIKVESVERARIPYDLMLYVNGDGPEDRVCPDALENNDTGTTAKSIGLGTTSNLLICWGSGAVQDPDYYAVFVPAGATLNVDVLFDHNQGDLNARVYRQSTASQPVGTSATQTDNEALSVTNAGNGEIYIVNIYGTGIQPFRNRYSIEVALSFAGVCDDDLIGEASLADATSPLAVGALNGLNLCEGLEDWFRLPAGTTSVDANLELNNLLGNIDFELVNSIAETVAASTGDTNIESIAVSGLDAGQTYYLRVFPKDNAFFRNEYDLWIGLNGSEPGAPFCPDDYERNDNMSVASPLASTIASFVDMTACGPDMDWYTVNAGATNVDHRVWVFYDHVNGEADLELEVRDSSGTVVTNGTSNTAENDAIVTFRPTAQGTHFIGVTNASTSVTEVPYYLHFGRVNVCPEDSFEPNNTVATAAELTQIPGTYALASCQGLNIQQDDYFRFNAGQAGTLTVDFYYNGAALQLYTEILAGGSIGNTTQDGPNRQRFSTTVAQGDFVRIYVGNSGTTYAPYFMKVNIE